MFCYWSSGLTLTPYLHSYYSFFYGPFVHFSFSFFVLSFFFLMPPVVALAGDYFRLMTGGRFVRLQVDEDNDAPLLLAQSAQGKAMEVAALSEGTADQLYLSLRLAALELQRQPDRMMPLVLDDVLMTADDERAAAMFCALEKFAVRAQVMVFTHHQHLLGLASGAVAGQGLKIHRLAADFGRSA